MNASATLDLLEDPPKRPAAGFGFALAFSPDERVLYVAGTPRRELRAEGVQTNGRRFATLHHPEPGGPDGLKLDEAGNLYVTGAAGVWVFAPDGACTLASFPPRRRPPTAPGATPTAVRSTSPRAPLATASGSGCRAHADAARPHRHRIPEGVRGRSLEPLLEGDVSLYDEVLIETIGDKRTLRTPHARLTWHGRGERGEYNLAEDPHCFHNLWDEPAAAELQRDLTDRLLAHLVANIDPLPPVVTLC